MAPETMHRPPRHISGSFSPRLWLVTQQSNKDSQPGSRTHPEKRSSQRHITRRTKGAEAAAVRADASRSSRVLKAQVCGTVAAAAPAQEIWLCFLSLTHGWLEEQEWYSGLGGGEKCAWVCTGKKGHTLAQITALQMNRRSWNTEWDTFTTQRGEKKSCDIHLHWLYTKEAQLRGLHLTYLCDLYRCSGLP